jgi:hypothetical protein
VSILEILLLGGIGCGVLWSWYYVVRVVRRESGRAQTGDDPFPIAEGEEISVHQLGEIEGSIDGLTDVIVVAHRVEEPMNTLRKAVKKNLESNVEYHFLVSKSRASAEIDGWVQVFLAIAHVVKKAAGSATKASEVVKISRLHFDHRDTPYVFYRAAQADGQLAVVAFRGNQVDEGIAERYTRLPAGIAFSLASALLSGAPEAIGVQRPEFEQPPRVDPATMTESR